MTWQDRIAVDRCEPSPPTETESTSHMTPGLTGTYDRELREKAGMHDPPVPPEYMGLEGEFDQCGLARRVAEALDSDPVLANVDSLMLTQRGSTIVFWGRIADHSTLGQIMDVASLVDGTRSLDVSKVAIGQEARP